MVEAKKHASGHFLIAWGMPNRAIFPAAVQQKILATFTGHAFTRIYDTAVVVALTYAEERHELADEIIEICEKFEESEGGTSLAVVISPISPVGLPYHGWLEEEVWDELNKRTIS
ncbi:hypothetical protein [Micromonospora noduli]|uniref:hypothetical protein n=1 Tax=Micromonospora noduli TaxID=709876 RepID=UPI0011BE30D7|nr:hypothetical protein [Micromonospora noduli]